MRERRAVWDGVSNALALKHIRSMAKGDHAFIYHSGDEKALVGLARIVSDPYPDPKGDDPKLAVVDIEAGDRLAAAGHARRGQGRPGLRRAGPGPDVAAQRHSRAAGAVEAAARGWRGVRRLKSLRQGRSAVHLVMCRHRISARRNAATSESSRVRDTQRSRIAAGARTSNGGDTMGLATDAAAGHARGRCPRGLRRRQRDQGTETAAVDTAARAADSAARAASDRARCAWRTS